MEKSPPGIQTIRAGAGPGAVGEFETVGANVIDPTDGHDSHSGAFDRGVAVAKRDLELRIASPITAPIAMTPKATNQRSLAVIDLFAHWVFVFRVSGSFFILFQARVRYDCWTPVIGARSSSQP